MISGTASPYNAGEYLDRLDDWVPANRRGGGRTGPGPVRTPQRRAHRATTPEHGTGREADWSVGVPPGESTE